MYFCGETKFYLKINSVSWHWANQLTDYKTTIVVSVILIGYFVFVNIQAMCCITLQKALVFCELTIQWWEAGVPWLDIQGRGFCLQPFFDSLDHV